jgi:Lrp/AsnC family transcriptional regulator, leucine-responsive regulatory protein
MRVTPPRLDATDHRIVAALQRNARSTFAEIGDEVGLSAPAVKRRVDRLESQGVIQGYSAIIDTTRLGLHLEAFAELQFVGSAPVGAIESLIDDVPEIQALFTIAGDPDALAWIKARDIPDLTRVIDDIRRTGLVTGTKTLMVLASKLRRGLI